MAGPITTIFFDGAGTLFRLTQTVGHHYAAVADEIGLQLDPNQLERAFAAAWRKMPPRPSVIGPRIDDDKGWWRELVTATLIQSAPALTELDRDNFFEIAYDHFAEAGVWELFPETLEVLLALHHRFRLALISNFDGRLRLVLQNLGISKFFRHVFISSELGADKPDPEIFRRALSFAQCPPNEVLHVGDDPVRDWEAARKAGLTVFPLQRPENSLANLLQLSELFARAN